MRLVTQLQLSHIVPKWAYRWCKAEGGVVGHYMTKNAITLKRDGTKQYLLCGDCEQRLGGTENYLAHITRGRYQDLSAIGVTLAMGPVLLGVEVAVVRRALAGIPIKAHFCGTPPFDRINLQTSALQRLKTSILDEGADGSQFAIMATRWISASEARINPRSAVFASTSVIGGASVFSLLAAGMEWTMVFEGTRRLPREFSWAVFRDCCCPVMFGDIVENRHFSYVAPLLPHNILTIPDWVAYPSEDTCPCGYDPECTYEECCAPTWRAAAIERFGTARPGLNRAERRAEVRRRQWMREKLPQVEPHLLPGHDVHGGT